MDKQGIECSFVNEKGELQPPIIKQLSIQARVCQLQAL